MNTLSFIGKGLRFRPQRTLFLLLGFAVGVMVMTVLLSVGTAVLDQAKDADLTGGGDIVLLPVGIDVSVLKTGGVTSMNFDIPNARFLTRELLAKRRLPGVATVSPELSRVYATLLHGGHEQMVRIEGVVPSRFRALWPAMTAALVDGPAERDYVDPEFTALLYEIDAFHPPVVDTSQVWAEWHYFNYHDDSGRSLYVSVSAVAFDQDLSASGYSRGVVLFEMVDPDGRQTKIVDTLPGREIAASYDSPDLVAGLNAVRLDGGVYAVSLSLADSLSRPVTVTLELTPTPHQYVPPVTPLGSDTPFGYVVPVLRGRMTGRVTMGGHTIQLDGTGYHDHNWGHFKNAVWDWGIVHAGPYSVLYGRFAASADELQQRPVLFAVYDGDGARPFVLTGDYRVDWRPGNQPAGVTLHFANGENSLTLVIAVERRFVSETGGGEQPLFRADESARSFFYQMEGKARLTGRLDGRAVDETGHAYSETFFVDR
ncbi:MAG TPA: hypothetical protein VFX92_14625 [Candidatus Krumholzibacteria bacterium]|nr:hypothetical protein [Candidatus Krumholzibacteria bacterium]